MVTQLKHHPQGKSEFRVSFWLCFLWHLSLTWYSLPFLSQKKKRQSSGHIIRLRNSSSPLPVGLYLLKSAENRCPLSAANLLLQEESHEQLLVLMNPSYLAVHLLGSASHWGGMVLSKTEVRAPSAGSEDVTLGKRGRTFFSKDKEAVFDPTKTSPQAVTTSSF